MCFWFNYVCWCLKGDCYFKMWYIIYMITLFAFRTALSSSPKRSAPDESTPAKEFEGTCAQYTKNNCKIQNCVL